MMQHLILCLLLCIVVTERLKSGDEGIGKNEKPFLVVVSNQGIACF
jgi:hypothetical protein